MACRRTAVYSLAVALFCWCQLLTVHAQEGSVMASLTITPGPAAGTVTIPESIGSIQACVVLSAEPTANVVITLQTIDTTTEAESDYESLSQELVFTPSPVLTQCVNITIIQEGAVENTFEFFSVQASTSSSGVTGLPASRFINIQDADQITIGFEQATYSIQEPPQSATLEVCAGILQGSVQRSTAVTFTFGVQDGLTDSGDYTLVGTMGSFLTGGDTQFCTNFSILGDNRVEGMESFTVTLTGPSNEVEVSSTAGSATVEIIDDDGATVSLQDVSPVLEPGNSTADNTTVDVCVSVDTAPGPIDRILVTFNTVEVTADSGDFQPLSNQMLTITGSMGCQPITILGDSVEENNETFSVTASVVSPNIITPPTTVSVTIMDDNDVECDVLSNPLNGFVSLPMVRVVGSEALYSCNGGFTLSGDSMRTCQSDGQWSGSEPTCVVVCEDLSDPENGNVNLPMVRVVGSEVSYSCNGGFTLSGDSMRTCQSDGQWSGSEPTCVVVCGDLSDPENGNVNLSMVRVVGSEASYSCNGGFTLSGDSVRTCQADGQWSGSDPTCVEVASDNVVAIAVGVSVGGVVLIVIIVVVIIILIAVCFRKKKTTNKYVLNYHTVHGTQMSSTGGDNGESGKKPPDSSGEIIGQAETETADTFHSTEQLI